jgi:hypothetical protein
MQFSEYPPGVTGQEDHITGGEETGLRVFKNYMGDVVVADFEGRALHCVNEAGVSMPVLSGYMVTYADEEWEELG